MFETAFRGRIGDVKALEIQGHSNSFQTKTFLERFRLKDLADDKINVTKKLEFVFERTESILGKGENACYQHFLPFHKCFQKPPSLGSLKVGIMW